ncbi:MAG: hypothetical protein DRQ62_15915 [Gammaproteobacteria bacterium]|nr:MAG: hypothetical protein DRQ62_15915 [Gammaproteobacteria bacterium]
MQHRVALFDRDTYKLLILIFKITTIYSSSQHGAVLDAVGFTNKARTRYEFVMKDMHIITATTPVVEVVKRYRYFFYSKHNDIYNELLQDEIPLVEKALQDFVDQLGEIQGSNKIWMAICIGVSHHLKSKTS